MKNINGKNLYQDLPETPGVYLMKNDSGRILYVGKAANLKRRVSSYFLRVQDSRISKLVSEIRSIETLRTDTALEALLLESRLIKKIKPPFNIKDKDNKSFLYIEITKEYFPRVHLVRATEKEQGVRYGPFISGSAARIALDILRHSFPWSIHEKIPQARPCLDYELGLCPGTCDEKISRHDYLKIIRQFKKFLIGKKDEVITELRREMEKHSQSDSFEEAAKVRNRLFALQHIRDTALILKESAADSKEQLRHRIEGYDISNISGTSAVGSMVVFNGSEPDKKSYRKFRIKSVKGANDIAMLKEVLRRRLRRAWQLPGLIVVDGGKQQLHAAQSMLKLFKIEIPLVSIAKGPDRKRNDIHGVLPSWTSSEAIERVRDEAHRFAVNYHRKLRSHNFIEK